MAGLRTCGLVLVICAFVGAQTEDRVIQTDQGPVRGYKSAHGDFYSFFGIPYATAPTGRDKFKAPLPPPSRTETFEATNEFILCPQQMFPGTEDCLVLNIHVPTRQHGPLPVMFYIHGGGFILGYGGMVTPEYIIGENVVFVTINYRLGATGTLCLNTEGIPGNAGFKDQVAALRWVQRNIANFGGNANDVTILGFSGGSISAEYMMLSPMASGLFHKVISESGNVLGPFAVAPEPIEFAKRFASDNLGRDVDDISEVEYYFLNAPSTELITDLYDEYQVRPNFEMGFTLCVEREIEGVESFMTKTPLEILESGNYYKVPYMTGIASDEGLLMMPQFDDFKIKMENNFPDFMPVGLNFPSESEKNQVANRIKEFYFKGQPVGDATIRGYVDFMSDVSFVSPQIRSARMHARNSVPVYLYYYSYVVSEYPRHMHDDKIRGANHHAQTYCVHRVRWMHNPVNESDTDVIMRNRLVQMWSNFVKYGVPVLQASSLLPMNWERMNADRMNYLSMDERLATRNHLLQDRIQLWDDIYEQYYGNSSPRLSFSWAIVLSIVMTLLVKCLR